MSRQAQVKGNVQEIRITIKGCYSPDVIRVKEGGPLRLVFDRQEASDCSDWVVFPGFQATKSGSFGFAYGMNMLHGTLIVEQNGVGSQGTDEPSGGHEAHGPLLRPSAWAPSWRSALLHKLNSPLSAAASPAHPAWLISSHSLTSCRG